MSDVLKPRISIVVGHDQKSQGAAIVQTERTKKYAAKTEYQYNTELSHYIAEALSPNYGVFIVFRDGLGIQKTYDELEKWDPKINIELHFNSSAKSKAYGTEVLVEKKWSHFGILVQAELCQALRREAGGDRGVKVIATNADRGYQSLKRLRCPDCIIEPFFGSNETDALLGLTSMQDIATAINRAISIWFLRGEVPG